MYNTVPVLVYFLLHTGKYFVDRIEVSFLLVNLDIGTSSGLAQVFHTVFGFSYIKNNQLIGRCLSANVANFIFSYVRCLFISARYRERISHFT